MESRRGSGPYDELPYRSRPVEWTAPERMALCSLLHGGPELPVGPYTVLELGCGDGANLIPMAFHRPDGTFVGVDASRHAIALARGRQAEVGIPNLRFLHADFATTAGQLDGLFDFIIVHGVLSWVDHETRDQLLDLCASRLAPTGLLYLNYNTQPGWAVRGLVRNFLLAQTDANASLAERTLQAQAIAAAAAAALRGVEHPYSQLMENEYRFVSEGHPSYVAHEFLAPDNHAYWRSEMLGLLRARGLTYLADADFNYDSGRVPVDLLQRIAQLGWNGQPAEDSADLFAYRQLHSPLVTHATCPRAPAALSRLSQLWLASPLIPAGPDADGVAHYRHPGGAEVEAREAHVMIALDRLATLWPRGLRLSELFDDVAASVDDVMLLHRHGMLELRCTEPGSPGAAGEALWERERAWGDYVTDATHRHHQAQSPDPAQNLV